MAMMMMMMMMMKIKITGEMYLWERGGGSGYNAQHKKKLFVNEQT